MKIEWHKKYLTWLESSTLYVSVPFTWELPEVRSMLQQKSFEWDRSVVGGPAIALMPNYLSNMANVTIGGRCKGVLQRFNPYATRTTTGCPNSCSFCAVPKTQGKLIELSDWPDLPVICDDNLLAASIKHFDKVIDKLIIHGWANFNQGLDCRRLTDYHAMRIAEIKDPVVYLALDSMERANDWLCAYDRLYSAGLNKSQIKSYALIGFDSDPLECWRRCEYINSFGIKPCPMWFHELNSFSRNTVTQKQLELGWTDRERKLIMQYYYQRGKRGAFIRRDYPDRLPPV